MNIKMAFDNMPRSSNLYRLYDEDSVLPFYYGFDENGLPSFGVKLTFLPSEIKSTKKLAVFQGKENDKFVTYVSLTDSEYINVFYSLADDLIESTESIQDEQQAFSCFVRRFECWKSLFSSIHENMSRSAIQGCYGELSFLLHLIEKVGGEKAIKSWAGPLGYDKDFSIDDTWYEIKTITTKADTVIITSLEQLDSNVPGHLVVYRVEGVAEETNYPLSDIVSLFRKIEEKLESYPASLDMFLQKISKIGFAPLDEYECIKFRIASVDSYRVDDHFPRLTPSMFPQKAIGRIRYELIIKDLGEYHDGK